MRSVAKKMSRLMRCGLWFPYPSWVKLEKKGRTPSPATWQVIGQIFPLSHEVFTFGATAAHEVERVVQ